MHRGRKDSGKSGPSRGRPRGRFIHRRKVCAFCVEGIAVIDYKDIGRLRRYTSDRARIEPRRKTGLCSGHQHDLSIAIKRARHLAMLPFTSAHTRMMA
jgi:small subunit ribosomal protein S18